MGKSRRHGVRPHVASGACPQGKTAYTTWNAATGAMRRVKDAIRVYHGKCCGYYHITKYEEGEYAQRVAEYMCTTPDSCDTMVSDERSLDDERREQAADARHAGTAAIRRVWEARLTSQAYADAARG
jgi:hypothetical protein